MHTFGRDIDKQLMKEYSNHLRQTLRDDTSDPTTTTTDADSSRDTLFISNAVRERFYTNTTPTSHTTPS